MTLCKDIKPVARTDGPPLSLFCKVITSFDSVAGMAEEWDRFVAGINSDIYFSHAWCRLWWEYYGSGRILRLFIFRAGVELVGIVPMFIEQVRVGAISLRLAKPVGSDFALCICNLPVRAEYASAVFRQVLEEIIGDDHCEAVWFGPLGGASDTAFTLRGVCKGLSSTIRLTRDVVLGPHTVFTLPNSVEAYLASLDKRQRGNYRRDLNLLSRDFRIDVDVITDEATALREFTNFKRMHEEQWRTENKLGHFGDWPRAAEFNLDQLRTQARLGRLRLVRLIADGNVVSCQLCYAFGDGFYWRLPARASGAEWDRYGLGRVGLVKMIEVAISEGMHRIEAGVGHYDYKVRLGGVEYPLHSILTVANRLGSRLRARAFCAWADTLHLLYYRIWFSRLAPVLPLKRRPLWRCWIRSRV